MSSAEAGLVLGLISSVITIIRTTQQVYEAVEDAKGLPANFKKTALKLPLISKLLEDAERYIESVADEDRRAVFMPTLENCELQATHLQELFTKVMPEKNDSRLDRYVKAARTIGKAGRVEELVRGMLDDLQLLATTFPEVTTLRGKEQLAKAIEEVAKMEPSLPDGFEEASTFAHYGSGAQNVNMSGSQYNNNITGNQNSPGQQYIGTNHIVSNHKNATVEDVDRACLRFLRCPDTLLVKNRLKENKDKLLLKSIDWIFQDPQYTSWKNKDNICLLWIKGGAGKGKTMMSIGLIEQLSLPQDESTVVTYFFCQNADYELNTLEAIIKGVQIEEESHVAFREYRTNKYQLLKVVEPKLQEIIPLLIEQKDLKESLRRRWDTVNERFDEDVTSWRTLWNIFLEMLHQCKHPRLYVIVDALDECQDNGMADFLKLIVRTGLDQPSKIKWLLTSRPLDSAEQALLAGSDQVGVSLELNQKHLSEAVKTYIAFKAIELDRRHHYGPLLRQKVETELTEKANSTYLWVSLVCKKLESVHRDMALTTIQDLPPGLHAFYYRVFDQLSKGESFIVNGCMRLLKVMMLAYRPLNVMEVSSVSGLSDEWVPIKLLIDRCASFIKMRGTTEIEFVHQSARDYLAGKNGQSIIDAYNQYGHSEIALSCLSYLSQQLKVNLVDLPRPDSTGGVMERNKLIASVDYAATFWMQHLESAKRTALIQNALAEQGEVGTFLCTKLLEWLECLSLLDKLPHAIEALKGLTDIADLKNPLLSMLIQDAIRFLLRHYLILATWPLQIYCSAIVFSPQISIVRRNNIDKIPAWLRRLPQMEDAWASLIQTLASHPGWVWAIAFSPDGKQIVSGSGNTTIKLWDAKTGNFQQTLTGHSEAVRAVAFSPNSKQIVSGSGDRTIKLWNAKTGDFQQTLTGHSSWVQAVVFSPDSKQIASGSDDNTIKLWDAKTGDLQQTLTGHFSSVLAVAFSLDGKQIVSGSGDTTIKLWDAKTSDLQQTLTGHSDAVRAVAFSPNSKQIVSGSLDNTIKLWDAETGDLQQTLTDHSSWVQAVVFSPDGKQIASASLDNTIKLWDAKTGNFQQTLTGHSSWVQAVVFSPDGKQIASGSLDNTIKLWDAETGDLQQTLAGHSDAVQAVVFSPNSKQIVSGSGDTTIKLWDAKTGDLQQTLTGHSDAVRAVAFSPNSKQIVSGSDDNTIKLWDAKTGNLQQTLTGHSSWVHAVAFSPDGKQIVSGSDDKTIKLWNITKVLKVSRLLGSRLGSHFKIKPWHEIKTSQTVNFLKFSVDGQHHVTNLGLVKIQRTIDSQFPAVKSLKNLSVCNQWICYGTLPVFFLPSDYQVDCYDVRDDQVVIGFVNGRVLSFDIDRASLNSMFKISR